MRRGFFVVNFAVASLLAIASGVGTVVGAQNPETRAFAVLGGLSAVLAFAWWAVAEWQGHVGERPDQERQAGLCSAFLGGLLLFAAVTSSLGGPADGVGAEVFWSVNAVMALVSVWFLACGVVRKRRTDPGDPVDPAD